jgi:hypothetical protein
MALKDAIHMMNIKNDTLFLVTVTEPIAQRFMFFGGKSDKLEEAQRHLEHEAKLMIDSAVKSTRELGVRQCLLYLID